MGGGDLQERSHPPPPPPLAADWGKQTAMSIPKLILMAEARRLSNHDGRSTKARRLGSRSADRSFRDWFTEIS